VYLNMKFNRITYQEPCHTAPTKTKRKPTLAAVLKQASRAGAKVRGAVLDPSGKIELRFGQAEQQTDTDRELEEFEARHG
jgi:hypothetical protein